MSLHFPGVLPLSVENSQLLDALAQQAGVALERCVPDHTTPSSSRPGGQGAESPLTARIHALEDSVARLHQDVLALRTVAREIAKSMQAGDSGTR